MEVAAVMAIALANGGGKPPNCQYSIGRRYCSCRCQASRRRSIQDWSASSYWGIPFFTRNSGDEVFFGSTCKQGEIEVVVIVTGVYTFFGKASHLVDSTNNIGHLQKMLTVIGNFCICSIAVGMVIEIIVMYPIQHRKYSDGIDNLLVLLMERIPISMPAVLSVTMTIGSHRLSEQGAITKRMTAIEEITGITILRSHKTRTLT